MVAAVALANKMARMIWAMSTKQEDYRMACPGPLRRRHGRKAGRAIDEEQATRTSKVMAGTFGPGARALQLSEPM